MIIREFLIDAGYTVLDVPDAASALGAMEDQGNEIDLLFTDIHMPRRHGRIAACSPGENASGQRSRC